MTEILPPLSGRLVLLIEEEPFLAGYISSSLIDAGAQILGPARTVEEADALLLRLRERPLAAVVSLGLFDAEDGTVANSLDRLGTPVLLIRKDGRRLLPSSTGHDMLTVPFAAYQVVDHMRTLLESAIALEAEERYGATLRGH